MVSFDHTIVSVNDLEESVAFWIRHLGLRDEGRHGPFAVLRVDTATLFQLAPWGTEGNGHFAFAFEPGDFDDAFDRLKADGIPYGDGPHDVGNLRGPGNEAGARGPGRTVYFLDPHRHLLEIRTYA